MPEETVIRTPGRDSDRPLARPASFSDFVGQREAMANLEVFIYAARLKGEQLDHILLHGPPGLGKTTIARIVANELGADMKSLTGPSIEKPGDLASVLVNLEAGDVLFIDEIHRLNEKVEEILYPAMEDYKVDILVGPEGQARAVTIELQPFTLIGATTRQGSLSEPLRDRFPIPLRLNYYTTDELRLVVARNAAFLGAGITEEAADEVARRSRYTPRIAGTLVKRIRDFAIAQGRETIDRETADASLNRLGVDRDGLDAADRRYLDCLESKFGGGPVGLETLAAALSESKETIQDAIEPFLLREGLVKLTARGRKIVREETGTLL